MFCWTDKFWTTMQILCDLICSKDGRILGEKRIPTKDEQFVKVFMTSPDLVWQGSFKDPRFGPKACLIAFKEVFKAMHGYEMDVIEYGKPFKKTYDYAKQVALRFARESEIEVTNFYMIGDNPTTDIKGGNLSGCITILVKTGVFREDAESSGKGNDLQNPAKYVVNDFQAAIKLICKLEGL